MLGSSFVISCILCMKSIQRATMTHPPGIRIAEGREEKRNENIITRSLHTRVGMTGINPAQPTPGLRQSQGFRCLNTRQLLSFAFYHPSSACLALPCPTMVDSKSCIRLITYEFSDSDSEGLEPGLDLRDLFLRKHT